MPIDKFGRHFHGPRHRAYPSHFFIKVKNLSELHTEMPLCISGLKTNADGFFKLGSGSTIYEFPLTSATVLHIRKNLSKVKMLINGVEVNDKVGTSLRKGDRIQFKLPNKSDNLLTVELILKCPLFSDFSSVGNEQ